MNFKSHEERGEKRKPEKTYTSYTSSSPDFSLLICIISLSRVKMYNIQKDACSHITLYKFTFWGANKLAAC